MLHQLLLNICTKQQNYLRNSNWKSNWSWFLMWCTVWFPPHRLHNMCKALSPTKKCLQPFLPALCYYVKIQMSTKILEFCAPGQKVSGQLCKFWSCLQWAGCVYLLTDWWCCGVSSGFQLISSPAPPSVPNIATLGKARCESQGGELFTAVTQESWNDFGFPVALNINPNVYLYHVNQLMALQVNFYWTQTWHNQNTAFKRPQEKKEWLI